MHEAGWSDFLLPVQARAEGQKAIEEVAAKTKQHLQSLSAVSLDALQEMRERYKDL